MNALQVTASIAPRDGGPSTAITNMNHALRDLGSKSLILTTLADGKRDSLPFSTSAAMMHMGTAVWFCPRNRPYVLKNSWRLGLRTLRLANRADILHVHGLFQANSIYAYLASLLTDTPYVLQPHGTLEPYQQGRSRLPKALFDRLIGNRIIEGASGVVAASTSEAENIAAQHPDALIHVIPLGVRGEEPERPTMADGHLDHWLAASLHRRVIYLGRLATKKRPDLLMRAWAAVHDDAELLIIGPPQDWDEATLRQTVPARVNARVTFLPSLGRPEVAWALSQAGIFVLPSENENFAIAVAEAMYYGCAIVSTKATAATEHVSAADSGIVLETADETLLGEALNSLICDAARTSRYGRAAEKYARENLTWHATAERLQALYTSLATPKPPVGLTI